jgi:hypothetical protein
MESVENFPACYGTGRFITALYDPSTCPYPEPDQLSPHHPIKNKKPLNMMNICTGIYGITLTIKTDVATSSDD